jgi:hypothetical protein
VAYVRTVKTSSGATAVQIVGSSRRGSRLIEHLGSAHDEAGLAALKAAAAQRLAAGQTELDLGVQDGPSRHCCRSPPRGRRICGRRYAVPTRCSDSMRLPGGDVVFRQLVLARIIEPTRMAAASYPTLNRRLPFFAKPAVRQALSSACAAHAALGPASLVLYESRMAQQ